jgi:SAM-dependent methyltransferase
MTTEPHRPDDPYSRTQYRKLIAWEKRIEREGPFLLRLLGEAPDRSVVDLGCGTGEHVAFFAQQGARAVGLDRSESMIESAREHEARGHGRFVEGDALDAAAVLGEEPPFGLALCLGNMLPHVQEDADLDRLLIQVARLLAPGGHFLLQILNYVRLLEGGVRHLPVNIREGEGDEEIVFLRLMKAQPEGRMLFFPTTLTLHADAEEPVAVKTTRRVPLRAWTLRDLEPRFEAASLGLRRFGNMQGGAYDPQASMDLVLVATRDA